MRERLSKVTPEIVALSEMCTRHGKIDSALYEKYQVKRGLRDINGKGVVTGLTEISEISAGKTSDDGTEIPSRGELFYRGYNINSLVNGFLNDQRFGYEEIAYLLLFGELPNAEELRSFSDILGQYRTLPVNFVTDIILKSPSSDMMNTLARSVLTLYAYDDNANDLSVPNILRQCLGLIALFPVLSVYGYQAYNHYYKGESLFIHRPQENLSTAENILLLLRPDGKYTELEAKILDIALVLQAEHGGGNNSTFTTHVVTSSGTDTYSVMASALGSLKGGRHGGANIKVTQMLKDIRNNVADWNDEEEIKNYLRKIIEGEAFDKSGLIYGMGHAVYSISDPRAEIFKGFVKRLAVVKGFEKEYNFYEKIENLAPDVISEKRKIYKGVSANVDFYSGFVYEMLGLPQELYTPIFAVARVAGWSAHRIEEIVNTGKIIRPAYKSIMPRREYIEMNKR